jgi:hypothetical protein
MGMLTGNNLGLRSLTPLCDKRLEIFAYRITPLRFDRFRS